ncbi:hypothetical protein ACF0H5_017137 [Mactra antiquata]
MEQAELKLPDSERKFKVPPDPKARLMYYIDCICQIVDLSDVENLIRLRKYTAYQVLSERETDALVSLGFLFSPDELCGKVIFQDDSLCGTKDNVFYDTKTMQEKLSLSEFLFIGGQQRRVLNIMAVRETWLTLNWKKPIQYFTPRLSRLAAGGDGVMTLERPPTNASARFDKESKHVTIISNSGDNSETSTNEDCCCRIV